LKVIDPEPMVSERTPLLRDQQSEDGAPSELANGDLEAQAEQEQREHDVGVTPIAEEPTFGKLVGTMSCLWIATFFAAMGTLVPISG